MELQSKLYVDLIIQKEQLKKQILGVKKDLKTIDGSSFGKTIKDQLLPKTSELKKVNQELTTLEKNSKSLFTQMQQGMKKVPFQGWALSIMFAGMAIERTFKSIAKTAISTFNEVSSTMMGTTTATTILSGTLKYLSFVVGQALNTVFAALLPYLLPIIDAITDWVQKHPKLTAAIVLGGLALGIFLKLMGMTVLVIANGLIPLFLGLKPIILAAFPAATLATFATALLILAGIVAVVIALWMSDLGGFKTFIIETFKILFVTVTEVFKDLWVFISSIFGFLVSVLKGDWDNAFKYLKNAFFALIRAILKLAIGLGMALTNLAIWVYNTIIDLALQVLLGGFLAITSKIKTLVLDVAIKMVEYFSNAIDVIIQKLQPLINAYNALAKRLGLSRFTVKLETAGDLSSMLKEKRQSIISENESQQAFIDELANTLKMDYYTSDYLQSVFDNINKYLPYSEITKEVSDKLDETESQDKEGIVDKLTELLDKLNQKEDENSSSTVNIENVTVETNDLDSLLEELNRIKG